jgi:hypothetical protein
MGGVSGRNRVEQLLARACDDAAFAEELIARRSCVAAAEGMELSASERAMLDAPTELQLRAAIGAVAQRRNAAPDLAAASMAPEGGLDAVRGIRPDRPFAAPQGIRPDLPPAGAEHQSVVRGHSVVVPVVVAAGAVILGAGAIATSCCTAGVRADMPPPRSPDPSSQSSRDASAAEPAPPPDSSEATRQR